jgi:tetraacyldisaccharide 4'-kinase
VTVISVGNIEIGGNGKTPFAAYILEQLSERGQRPAYVSRGFKSEAEATRPITVVAPIDVTMPLKLDDGVRWVTRDHAHLSRVIGDEGAMVATRCPSAALLFSRDKRAAVDMAVTLFHPTHVVLDDAFQSWRVHRDLDVVLVDAIRPFGNGRLVPAGTLRESPEALGRADIIGVNGYRSPSDLEVFEETVRRLTGKRTPVFGLVRKTTLVDPRKKSPKKSAEVTPPVASLSSIARPQSFDDALTEVGVALALSIRYPDHHRYSAADLQHIQRVLERSGCASIVTTEKDWAKLRERSLPFHSIYVSRLELSIDRGDILSHIEKPQGLPAASS